MRQRGGNRRRRRRSEEILAGLSSLVKAIARRPWFPESNLP